MTRCIYLLALLAVAQGYQPASTRRDALRQVIGSAAAIVTGSIGSAAPAHAVLSSKGCASGVGEGCADLAEDNAFIKSLQEKSAANRETYARVRSIMLDDDDDEWSI
jgi:hypothetical protein